MEERKDAFLNQMIKMSPRQDVILMLLQLLRHLFKISTIILEFNMFLTRLPNNFIFQKVQEEIQGTVTLESILTSKKGFLGDVYMIQIFQQT